MAAGAEVGPGLLAQAVSVEPIGGDGASGASLERLRMADGSSLVLKRQSPQTDLLMRILGDERARELDLFRRGVLDRLPPSVGHAVLGGWTEGETTVIVMRDLGDRVLGWHDRLTRTRTRDLVHRLADVHAHFTGRPPEDLAPLASLVGAFSPVVMEPLLATGHRLVAAALDGWELFADQVSADVAIGVRTLLEDPTPLTDALAQCEPTLCHGDLATVNFAWEDGVLTLIDWGQAVAAPGELDITRLLAGCAPALGLSREDFLQEYDNAYPASSAHALRLALLGGLLWLGWDKALGAEKHPDPARRALERADLAWWVEHSRPALAEVL